MNYYVQKDEKIVLFDSNKEKLIDTIAFMPQYQGLEILDTDREIITLDGEFRFKDEVEAELEQKERERIAHLSLTRGDVFRGLLMARGVTRLQLRGMIESNQQLTEIQKEMALIDFDEALNFYRGNALIDTVGLSLGIQPEQLDCFFETNDYTCLLPPVEPEEPVEEVQE